MRAGEVCVVSLVADGYDGRVGKEVVGSSVAVGAAHRLAAGRDIGRLSVNHFWPLLLCGDVGRGWEAVGGETL